MLQNRVDPFGKLIKTKARCKWLGNRGQLHGKGKTILWPFKHKAWIICLLEFKNRHREIMAPNLWIELFFLDEATALAAGHRPCFECRRANANLFKESWLKGNPEYSFDVTSIGKIDEIIHLERIDSKGNKVKFETLVDDLPDGTCIELDYEAYLLANNMLFKWTPFGYEKGKEKPSKSTVTVLTPRSIVNAIKAGYELQISV